MLLDIIVDRWCGWYADKDECRCVWSQFTAADVPWHWSSWRRHSRNRLWLYIVHSAVAAYTVLPAGWCRSKPEPGDELWTLHDLQYVNFSTASAHILLSTVSSQCIRNGVESSRTVSLQFCLHQIIPKWVQLYCFVNWFSDSVLHFSFYLLCKADAVDCGKPRK